MQRVMRCKVLLAACLAAMILTGAARAQGDKPAAGPLDRKSLDGMIHGNLKDVINHGANLYNSGDWNGCYRLWEGTLMGLKPLLAHRPELQKAIDTGIASAQQEPMLYRRAFVLRTVLDQVRGDLKGGTPKKKEEGTAVKPKGPDKVKPVDTPKTVDVPKKKTLWERLGGEKGVAKIVDDVVNAAARDPKVDFFRGGKRKMDAAAIAKMKHEIVEQVSDKAGGNLHYDGPDMKKVHRDMGITNEQFDALAGHLKDALQKNKVADQDAATVLAAIGSYRKEIVQPAKTEDKKPVDKKPEDKKPIDKKPVDKKPEDKKPVDKKPEDKKPTDTKPVDKKPTDTKPVDKKPTDTKPVDKKPTTPTPPTDKKETVGSVKGKVSYKGKPVTTGTITFEGKGGEEVATVIAPAGTYSVTRLKPGEYKVTIKQPAKRAAVGAKPADAKEPAEVTIPAKYADTKTSGLTIKVIEGAQTHDINLN